MTYISSGRRARMEIALLRILPQERDYIILSSLEVEIAYGAIVYAL